MPNLNLFRFKLSTAILFITLCAVYFGTFSVSASLFEVPYLDGIKSYATSIPADLVSLFGIAFLWERREKQPGVAITLIVALSGMMMASLGSWSLALLASNWTVYPGNANSSWTAIAILQAALPLLHLVSWAILLCVVIIGVSRAPNEPPIPTNPK